MAEHKKIEYKWIVLSVTTIGALMAAIDSTIVVLALPNMMIDLHASLVSMVWVIMGYLLVSTAFLLTLGKVADMFGRVRMYNLGFVIFTIGSLLCGLSNTVASLIASRLVQGIGAAMMMVNSIAIITEVFHSSERGKALGINGITFAAGGVIGPVLGGLILTMASWRWIFFINIPIGILGAIWGYTALKELHIRKKEEKFDYIGAATYITGLTSILIALSLGIELGFLSPLILMLYALFIALLIFFLKWESKTKNPVLHFNLFKENAFIYAATAATLQALAMFAVNFLAIFYMIGVRGYSPLTAAFLLIPLPLMMSIVAPISGRLSDKIGARTPATIGLLIQTTALILLLRLSPTTTYTEIAISFALLGIGGGLFWSPNTSAAMNAAPPEALGVASGTLGTLRQTGMVASFAISLAVAAASLPKDVVLNLFVGTDVKLGSALTQNFITGMHNAFIISIILCLAAAFFSFNRTKKNK